jgi:DNA-directed RNA polymerase subunit omega
VIFMITPSTKDLINIVDSKYAVVVAVAKRARVLAEQKKEEDLRLSTMVSEALDDVIQRKVSIKLE